MNMRFLACAEQEAAEAVNYHVRRHSKVVIFLPRCVFFVASFGSVVIQECVRFCRAVAEGLAGAGRRGGMRGYFFYS